MVHVGRGTGLVVAQALSETLGGGPQPDLLEARQMQALSFAVHIPLVCFGIAFPAMVLFTEWLHMRTGSPVYKALAKRWSKVALAAPIRRSTSRQCRARHRCIVCWSYREPPWPPAGSGPVAPARRLPTGGLGVARGASEAELKPHKIEGTMAFMVESCWPFRPTPHALECSEMQKDYDAVWGGFPKAKLK